MPCCHLHPHLLPLLQVQAQTRPPRLTAAHLVLAAWTLLLLLLLQPRPLLGHPWRTGAVQSKGPQQGGGLQQQLLVVLLLLPLVVAEHLKPRQRVAVERVLGRLNPPSSEEEEGEVEEVVVVAVAVAVGRGRRALQRRTAVRWAAAVEGPQPPLRQWGRPRRLWCGGRA